MLAEKLQANVNDLWQRYKEQEDIQAREELIVQYASLVKYVAGRLAISLPANVQRDDLISYGIFGLIDALEKFDHTRGIKFETYAISRIKGSIWDGLRAMDWVPYSIRQKAKELEKTYIILENQLGRAATDEEVCTAMKITLAQFHQMLAETSATSVLSLDEIWRLDNDHSDPVRLLDTIEDTNASDPTIMAEYEEMKGILADAIGKLPERERMVIALYYYEGLTLKEIGEVLGVTESRISQMHTKAILRLRGRLSRIKKKLF
ncbi:MAG: RNA polymerase sigma factor WhiG [Clostridia bacterium]|nr:RNA polymerase sigma factor WhiG [Clostridia bacterium]